MASISNKFNSLPVLYLVLQNLNIVGFALFSMGNPKLKTDRIELSVFTTTTTKRLQ